MATKKQSQWDAARLLTTLNYFGEIPFVGSFRWLQQLLGQNAVIPGIKLSAMKTKIAVVGADCAQLVGLLQKQLAPSADLIFYDLQQGSATARKQTYTLSLDLKELIRTADTVVVLNTTECLDLMGDLTVYCQQTADFAYQSVFDFSFADFDLSTWGALDDVVMGGVSQGSFFKREQEAVFAGNVSTDNSGGFSSVRTKNFDPPFDFSGWRGMRLRVLGDGQRYKFILRNSGGWDSPAYIYGFDTVQGEWINVSIPFEEMVPTFRAKSVTGAPAFDPANVCSLQLMLSKFEYDRRLNPEFVPGPFELGVREIGVYRPRRGARLIVAGTQDENAQLREQLDEAQLDYRLIESGNEDLASAISNVL